MLKINVPEPSQWTSNPDIDQIALEYNLLYREKCGNGRGYPVDVEQFADTVLEISVVQNYFDAPQGAVALARCKPDERDTTRFVIEFNEAHRQKLEEKPECNRAVGSHEVGHIVLRHHDKLNLSQTPSLFDDFKPEPKFLHKTEWNHHAFSADELKCLCEMALNGNDRVRKILQGFDEYFEEKWMFWQAEHFALCFLIPKDSLLNALDSGFNPTNWREIYDLGEQFGVTGSMLATRLKKLNAIEIHGKQIVLGGMLKQKNLLSEQIH